MPALLGSLALVVPSLFVAVPTFQQSLITAGHPIAPEQCACAASPPASNGELKWCQSVGKPHETLADKTGTTPTDASAWKSRRFDFMGTGVFQLARTKGACACSDHDDVEVQSFMCGTKYWGKGASTNAAIAVRVQNTTFVISAQDDVLSVSGSENAVLAPVDEELERAFGLTVVSRETTTYKSETKYAWRIAFPSGGSLLALRWPVDNLPTGAMLHTWTSLPQEAPLTEGLCASQCPDLPAAPCGAFETGSSYVGGDVGKCMVAPSAWSCSHKCWQANRGEDVRFTYTGASAQNATAKSCCCKKANATAVSNAHNGNMRTHVSGRACKKPCGTSSAHCLHTKHADALFNVSLRKSLEETCGLLESTRPDEEPTDCFTAPPVTCGIKFGFKDKAWTSKFDWRLVSPKSNTWNKPKCIQWCEGAVLQPQDHLFNKPEDGDVCKLRKSLLGGAKVRCGWDMANKKCSLFVGNNMKHQPQKKNALPRLRQRKSMAKDCSVRVENITECPPDVEDVCEGTGIALVEAEEACTRHNNTDNFDWCVFDYCATNGDPEVPEYWHPPGNVTEPLETAKPQSAASSADSTESAAGSAAGHLEAQEAEEPLTIKAPEPEEPTTPPSSSDAEHPHNKAMANRASAAAAAAEAGPDVESKDAETHSPDAEHSPPNPPRAPDEPCTELPCHHDGKSPGDAALNSTVHQTTVHHSSGDGTMTVHQSTVHHSTVHRSTAPDTDPPSSSAPPNPPRAPDEPCTELPCHHDGKSPGELSEDELSEGEMNAIMTALNSTAADVWGAATRAAGLPSDADLASSPNTELPSTPPSASDAAESTEADEQSSHHFSLSTESKDQEHSPKFVVNGKNRHFWVPTGTPTHLLEWTAHEGGRTFVLQGETFGEGASEWFKRYVLLTNGTEVLQVGIAAEHLPTTVAAGNHVADSDTSTPKHPLRTLGVWVDGAAMKTTGKEVKSTLKGVSALATSRKWGMIGSTHAEEVEIHAPGMHLTIGSQGAKAYESEAERVRWAHLDIQIHSKLPKNSSGFVAELSGLQPLSDRSKALLSMPKEAYTGVQKDAERRRSDATARFAATRASRAAAAAALQSASR